jgi:polar amino acid transport system substrate-binding protein
MQVRIAVGGYLVKTRKARRPLIATAAVSVAALIAAACGTNGNGGGGGGGGSGSTSSPAASASASVASIANQVPSDIQDKGTLNVAADATYAPNEFIAEDGKTVIGMSADLSKALGQVMGLKVNMTNATFDTILPGLQSGKYDLGVSSFTDTREREKIVDFVTYFVAGTSFYVKSSGGPAVTNLAGLCGRTVAVEKGTTQQDDAQAQSTKCRAAGNEPVTVQVYNDQNAVNLALSSGRAQVAMADSPVAEYQVKQSSGAFKVSGPSYGTAPYGVAIPKDSGMVQPTLAAVKHIMDDGTYTKILKKWGLQSGAINNPGINKAVS